jgi:PAS domain S-box-containing protein
VTKDGCLIDVSLALPIRDASGTVIGAMAGDRDITERNRDDARLRESEARLRSIVDSAVDAIMLIDARGHIESFNPGAERLFGYSADEVIGRNVSFLMPSPDREHHDGYIAHYLDPSRRLLASGETHRAPEGYRTPGRLFVGN